MSLNVIHPATNPKRQQGAALVIGLLMLVIVTMLALAGMNTASTELTMAINERVRDNAFRASEAGLEQALSVLPSVPQNLLAPTTVGPVVMPGAPDDTFATVSQYMGDGEMVPGMSVGKFIGVHYDVSATGTSLRNATMLQVQGAYVVAAGSGGENFGALPP